MGLFDIFKNNFKKKTTDVDFENVKYTGKMNLENNFDGPIDSPTWQQVQIYINKMVQNNEEFVTLTLSEAVYGVRYMQACSVKGKYSLQLGVETDSKTNLVEKVCDKKELVERFAQFYEYGFVHDMDQFKPVSFFA
ncbi:MAG: hypothetical protein J1E83_06265 [Lachnospiraceae bacterium]|nr:hypothetical protein [Lachnospiraceae bacterium]